MVHRRGSNCSFGGHRTSVHSEALFHRQEVNNIEGDIVSISLLLERVLLSVASFSHDFGRLIMILC